MRQRSDVRPGDDSEAREGGQRCGEYARDFVPQPQPAEDQQHGDAEKREDEREGFGEVCAAEREPHQRGIAHAPGGQMREQRGQREEQKRLQQRVRPHLAQRQFALAGDDHQRQAEVAERVFGQQESGAEATGESAARRRTIESVKQTMAEHLQQEDGEVDQ